MTKKLQLARLAIFFVLLANGCASGLKATVCLVDSANAGFQCAYNGDAAHGYFLPLEKGADLLCASPEDTEDFIKACKNHQILPIPLCSLNMPGFLCTTPSSDHYYLSLPQLDNFVCLSSIDRKRLIQRCQ